MCFHTERLVIAVYNILRLPGHGWDKGALGGPRILHGHALLRTSDVEALPCRNLFELISASAGSGECCMRAGNAPTVLIVLLIT